MLAPLVALLVVGLAGWQTLNRTVRISSCGGESAEIPALPFEPYFIQVDPTWSKDTIGGSGETISAVGCTLCCLSMAFSHVGLATDPQRLNAELKAHDGYTQQGWLKWEVAEKIVGKGVEIDVVRRPSHAKIDAALRAGQPVLTRIRLWDSLPHWVLIVGKKGEEYQVKNPLCLDRQLQALSTLTRNIEAIRIVKRAR
jgi:hypothetical protein